MKRRDFIKNSAYGSCLAMGLPFIGSPLNLAGLGNPTIRNDIWIWGHVEGIHNGKWGLPSGAKGSKITMMESCRYMGIENCMVVGIDGTPAPGTEEKYASQLSKCKRVGWSVVPAGNANDIVIDHISPVKQVLELSKKHSNIRDVMFDDYFIADKPRCTSEQLSEMRGMLRNTKNPLDMWVVFYDYNLKKFLDEDQLKYFDVINFWTWEASNLIELESNIKKLRSLAPDKRIVLGCYMYDYGVSKPIPIERMVEQCNVALKFLKEGTIEGIVFLATVITDLKLDAVEWSREWIAHVGNKNIRDIDLAEVDSWTKKSIQKYLK